MSKVELQFESVQAGATRDRILDVAERLFAESGVAGTSVRAITDSAGVNVAAVNYHFRTKEGLIRAVIERRLTGLEEARFVAFDALQARAQREGRGPSVIELVEALIAPVFAQALSDDPGWPNFIRFISRLAWEPGVEALAPPESSLRLFQRFDAALKQALPDLAQDDGVRIWRLAFMRGATQHALLMITALRTKKLPKEVPFAAAIAATDVETIKREVISFVAAGLAAQRR